MIELLGQSVEGQIVKEVKKATIHLRGSPLEDDAVGPDGVPPENMMMLGGGTAGMKKLLQTKVEK